MHIIPADDAKIGLVNKDDMWDTQVTLFNESNDIEAWNYYFGNLLGNKASFESLVQFDKLLKSGNKTAMERFKEVFNLSDAKAKVAAKGFLKEIFNAYSAAGTGHTAVTTATMPHKYNGEVWVGGPVVIINNEMWQKLQKSYRASIK